jgi:hypothetical protein
MDDNLGAGIASVHVADVGVGRAISMMRGAPRPGAVDGLCHANIGIAAPLSAKALPAPAIGRVGLIAFWDDDAALDRFLADHPLAAKLADGWHVRLEPQRAFGSWPGLAASIPSARATDYDGPVVALTFGRLRFTQAPRFLRTSAKASGAAKSAPGLIWGTALTRPPFMATCSLWESTRAVSTYAYGHGQPAHSNAIDVDKAKPFHHESAFVRFRPYAAHGHLDGRNPLPEHAVSS